MIITLQKPWDAIVADLGEHRRAFLELRGCDAPAPIVGAFVVCDRDSERAREAAHRYLCAYYDSVIQHYDLGGTQFKGTRGYEYYDNMAMKVRKYGSESGHFFAELQVLLFRLIDDGLLEDSCRDEHLAGGAIVRKTYLLTQTGKTYIDQWLGLGYTSDP